MNLGLSFSEKADFQLHRSNNKKVVWTLQRHSDRNIYHSNLFLLFSFVTYMAYFAILICLPQNSINFLNLFDFRFQDKNNSKLHEHALIYTSTLLKIGTIFPVIKNGLIFQIRFSIIDHCANSGIVEASPKMNSLRQHLVKNPSQTDK